MATEAETGWTVDGPPENQIVWDGDGMRVCFLAHSNGRNQKRDLARGRLVSSAPDTAAALEQLLNAVCGETGFANAVRTESGTAYPWPALDLAEASARAALAKARPSTESN